MALIQGNNSPEYLSGTASADQIYGADGDDAIAGNGGPDLLSGDAGNDTLSGGSGNDTQYGGLGNDTLGNIEDFGNDLELGGEGDDTFLDDIGNDTLRGEGGNDTFRVPAFNSDSGTLGAYYATAAGGAGQDTYVIGRTAHGSNFPFPEISNSNYVVTDFAAGAGGDLINVNHLLENSGVLNYQGGNPFPKYLRLLQANADTKVQWDADGAGAEYTWRTVLTLRGVTSSTLTADNFSGGISPSGGAVPGESISGAAGADTLQGGFFNDTITGLEGNDVLIGRGGNDIIQAGEGDDRITGGAGNDTMDGGGGDDTFIVAFQGTASVATGGAGNDVYEIQSGVTVNRGYTITDFSAGDRIDVSALLEASSQPFLENPYIGGNPFAASLGFLSLAQSGANTRLRWDLDGAAGDQYDPVTVLTLKNVLPGEVTADSFVGDIPPDGSVGPGDTIAGGSGNDRFRGTLFDDQMSGLEGDDTLRGDAGNDSMDGGDGHDLVLGGLGNDTIYGGAGDDSFRVDIGELQLGDDWMYGGEGRDAFSDSHGNNVIDGGGGNDFFSVGDTAAAEGANTVTGGAGQDNFYLVEVTEHQVYRVTDFAAGAGGDILNVDRILGVSAGDGGYSEGDPFRLGYLRLSASGGSTHVLWDQDGAAGTEHAFVRLMTLLNVAPSSITSDNFLGQLVVGTAGNDDLAGGIGNDTVQGLAGNDTLDGSLGYDTLDGGSGDDLYFVDHAADQVIEDSNAVPGALLLPGGPASGPGLAGVAGITDTVIAAVNYTLAGFEFVENLTLAGAAARGTGNELANTLKGNAGADILEGAGGNDVLNGGEGNDSLNGGAGNDKLVGGTGNDKLVWGVGDTLDGSGGTDTLQLTEGDLDLTALPNTRIKNVEQIDLTGGGNSTLTLNVQDVLTISSSTDTLKVLGSAGDVVDMTGFTQTTGVTGFNRYVGGGATLLVDQDVSVV